MVFRTYTGNSLSNKFQFARSTPQFLPFFWWRMHDASSGSGWRWRSPDTECSCKYIE